MFWQKMVLSLASDEAVWNAVMNNEVVRELSETYYAGWSEFYECFGQWLILCSVT